jgi:AcrR family transcriptional regulator
MIEKVPVSVRKNRGRPPEDRFARRSEIYDRIAPLVLERGAGALSMRELARAAHMSVGGLYHYFSAKRELLFFPLLPDTCQEQYDRFRGRYEHLRLEDPAGYLDEFLWEIASSALQIRPAVVAALEIGAGDLWQTMAQSMQLEMSDLLGVVGEAHGIGPADLLPLARQIRRTVMGAMFDPDITAQDLLDQLDALITGTAGRASGHDRTVPPDAGQQPWTDGRPRSTVPSTPGELRARRG